MSISTLMKNEILEQKLTKRCCVLAFLSGVIKGVGSLLIVDKKLLLILQHNLASLIERCSSLIEEITNEPPSIIKKERVKALLEKEVYELRLSERATAKILQLTKIIDENGNIIKGFSQAYLSDCCKRQLLRGIFISVGSLSNDSFLEITLKDEETANDLLRLLNELPFSFKLRERKNQFIVYSKMQDNITGFAAYINVTKSYFELTDVFMKRGLVNDTNRIINCEMANIEKALDASKKQIDAITLIEKTVGLKSLTKALYDTAKARLENPEASLSELLPLLKIPATRSGLNHRLRKLVEIAKSLTATE